MHIRVHSSLTIYVCHVGADAPLLRDVSLALPPGRMGLVYGRSGAGKTTLLQLLAGMAKPSSGTVSVTTSKQIAQGNGSGLTAGMTPSQLAAVVGLVFQFPERHFLGATLIEVRAAHVKPAITAPTKYSTGSSFAWVESK